MKYTLILLEQPILVSDEEIKEGELFAHYWYDTEYSNERNQQRIIISTADSHTNDIKHRKNYIGKIIAGLPSLPSIDFNGFEEKFGKVDVEKLANENWNSDKYNEEMFENQKVAYCAGYWEGFKAAQSLSDKKYSEKDMNKALSYGYHVAKDEAKGIPSMGYGTRFFQSLTQPKQFKVEVEMDEIIIQDYADTPTSPLPPMKKLKCDFPKIEKNSIKITKVL